MENDAARAAVTAELERILAGPAFRGAKRAQEFLRYVVEHSLEGRFESLKERCIGTDVFGRAADYDTGDDSIVRVKASEVRKRLAQHYREAGPGGEVQIELPSGAYAPEFRFSAPPSECSGGRAKRRLWAAGAIAAAMFAGAAAIRWNRPAAPIDGFWRPVFSNRRPVLLCVAHPAVYRLTGAARTAFEEGSPAASIPAAQIARDAEHYVGFGDALALAHLSAFCSGRGKSVQLRMGNDIAFADLRGHPAVLIGAFTNQWTMELTSDLRFTFERTANGPIIRDRLTARAWSSSPNRDYAVVARIGNSKSGEMAVTAAGLSHFGTQMAGEFLISPAAFEAAMQQAPADWPTRNMQLVLEADVIGRTPGPPRVVASYFWSPADQPGGHGLKEAEGLP